METPKERDRVEAELKEKSLNTQSPLDMLQKEASEAGSGLLKMLRENPILMVGGILAAGVLARFFTRRMGGKVKVGSGDEHKQILESYIDAIVDDARHAVATGAEAGDAIREALQDRVPLVVYSPEKAAQKKGLFLQLIELSVTTAVGFALRSGMERMAARMELMGQTTGVPAAAEQQEESVNTRDFQRG